MVEKTIDPLTHVLVPKHTILSEEEKKEVLNKYNIAKKQLPRILSSDVIVKAINGKPGDIIKITRKSPTAGESNFYRVVINAK